MTATRELLLLRHGAADRGRSDRARELTDDGVRDVERIGFYLRERDLLPERTVASPAVRATVTAQKALAAGGLDPATLSIDERIYEASVGELLSVLESAARGPGRLMLVGHNPGIAGLVGFLSGRSLSVSPGTLIRLAAPADWMALQPGSAQLLESVDPRSLAGLP